MKNLRLNIVLAVFFVLGAAMFSRLFFLQILNSKFYKSQALGQQAGFSEVQGVRGEIFLKNSDETDGVMGTGDAISLAVNKEAWVVAAKPAEIEDKENFAEVLAIEIAETKDFVLSKISANSSYIVIKKDISANDISKIKALNLKGLYWEKSTKRYYPQKSLAANIIGFLGGNGLGQYGLEGYFEDVLKSESGIKEQKRGLALIGFKNDNDLLDGADIYLTIDYDIQFEAEALLKEAKQNLDIESGQIIVIKPDSGRILAMASYPYFNPNEYSKETDLGVFQNSSVQKLFEPGSVMKPFTMAMGLNEGKVTPDTTFTDTGVVNIKKDAIYNFAHAKYGLQTMTQVLEKSINTGAVFVEHTIPHKTFMDYLDKFGFGRKTEIDLQGEVYSKNELLRRGGDMEYATASFGQGIQVTPIQLVAAFSAIANGGTLYRPYVVEKIVRGEGAEEVTEPKIVEKEIISQKTASEMRTMLTSVVEKGYPSVAKINGYYLAGKTGTAEVPYENKKGYYPDKTIQSFIGFGPSMDPQFLILVKLDNPKVPKSSLSAVPLFKKLAQYIINYWQIPPDYDVTSQPTNN